MDGELALEFLTLLLLDIDSPRSPHLALMIFLRSIQMSKREGEFKILDFS